jgi:hypothetical protein
VVENGIKGDTNMEKVSKLSPAFVKPHGTHLCCATAALDCHCVLRYLSACHYVLY